MTKIMEFKSNIRHSLIFFVFIFLSCKGQEDKKITMDKETTKEYKKYKEQKHRIAFNGCDLSYNEKPIYLGSDLEEIIKILGEYGYKDVNEYGGIYAWPDIGLFFSERFKWNKEKKLE